MLLCVASCLLLPVDVGTGRDNAETLQLSCFDLVGTVVTITFIE